MACGGSKVRLALASREQWHSCVQKGKVGVNMHQQEPKAILTSESEGKYTQFNGKLGRRRSWC